MIWGSASLNALRVAPRRTTVAGATLGVVAVGAVIPEGKVALGRLAQAVAYESHVIFRRCDRLRRTRPPDLIRSEVRGKLGGSRGGFAETKQRRVPLRKHLANVRIGASHLPLALDDTSIRFLAPAAALSDTR